MGYLSIVLWDLWDGSFVTSLYCYYLKPEWILSVFMGYILDPLLLTGTNFKARMDN